MTEPTPPFVQREHPLHEPIAYFVENMTEADRRRCHDLETYFVGRGASAKAEAALAEVMARRSKGDSRVRVATTQPPPSARAL